MGIRKWIMKQYWRLVQVRGIWNLFYGILLLAIAYYMYIPFFYDMGATGPFVLAGVLLITFLIIGYLYDRVFVMWGPQQEVSIERNPFSFVPQPQDHIFWFPTYAGILEASAKLAEAFDLDMTTIRETREYFDELQNFSPLTPGDIDRAIEHRIEFVKSHPFAEITRSSDEQED
ncbi:MAG: hypothetical protein ACFFD8_09180 [Candidatus Thorarchaeota archaeon]